MFFHIFLKKNLRIREKISNFAGFFRFTKGTKETEKIIGSRIKRIKRILKKIKIQQKLLTYY